MEGEKPAAEEDENLLHGHMAASSADQELPIMHWEELGQRISELEKQEQQRGDGAKGRLPGFLRGTVERTEEGAVWKNIWEEEEQLRRCWVTAVTSRFHSHSNLQLCFTNNSDSEDDEEGSSNKVTEAGHHSCRAAGLKQEVATALRTLRDELLAEQEQEQLAGSSSVAKRKHLELWELQDCSLQQLSSMRASLQQEIHALSSELVAHLLVRDQLRTKQDAMLLDVQDLT